MAKPTTTSTSAADLARLLVALADADTVHRDTYLRRARALLADELPADRYRGMRGVQHQIDDAIARSRSAAVIQDWKLVHELAAKADQLRKSAETAAPLIGIGEQVYDPPAIALDPFSPGLAALAKAPDLAKTRDDAVAALTRLAAADTPNAAFYEARRTYLAALAVARRTAEVEKESARPVRSVAELERLAFEAAQQGEVGELQRLAQEILTQKAAEKKPEGKTAVTPEAAAPPTTAATADQCPVDLGAPFAAGVDARARALGFAVALTEPLPEAAPLVDFVAARIGQSLLQDATNEHEGTMKIEALVDQGTWPAGASEHIKTLVGQFVRNVFVNSGGARYRPAFLAESVMIEDFPEDKDPPADSRVLAALGLRQRRGLARDDIESALLAHGAEVLGELGLDPVEFRLVCIPQDLFSRFGRDRGWGSAQQWTHFDGYQVIKGGRLRALVGGHARYGGLQDLASIAPSDQRDTVIARFAVVRRARHVARWR
jgi:hypothetical protein